MLLSSILAAAFVVPLAAAHGGMEGMPRIFGLPKELRASHPLAGLTGRHAAEPARHFGPRQAETRCGPSNGNKKCAQNECCSVDGYCGTTTEHCQAPDCLLDFGPACDANKIPAGASTRNDPRPKLGSIPYGGEGIYVCNDPGKVAITYDDGPYIYTEGVMKQFEARGAHATFFITGNNNGKGAIDEKWAAVVKKMYDNGHQVASHTWSHQDLSKITKQQAYDQMVHNEMAIRNIIGKYPTYMRPPYSSCNAQCQAVMSELGYVVSYFDLDTDDYNQLNTIQVAKDNFKKGIDSRNTAPFDGDRLVIGHDIHQQTAENLTTYMLDYLYKQGLQAVTMGECLKDPKANWYRDSAPAAPGTIVSSTVAAAPAPSATGPPTTDGSCGPANGGKTCMGFVAADGWIWQVR
ncbi:Chitin binding protein [Pyrenophora tritici-repentis]|nr:Chitin binding protein [Pyrenophora tritici-repentis]KAF7452842.1 Chitin binding protein [Pyrenophora tritici-repentis]KAI0572826.1 Chitin binding protein [Pyrenophora tritici-repentis]